jgi:hypothetical protein
LNAHSQGAEQGVSAPGLVRASETISLTFGSADFQFGIMEHAIAARVDQKLAILGKTRESSRVTTAKERNSTSLAPCVFCAGVDEDHTAPTIGQGSKRLEDAGRSNLRKQS